MPISLNKDMMRQIILDHHQNPIHKHEPKHSSYKSIHLDSPNCIDDITVFLSVEDDKIIDACFQGTACTISTASTDILCDLVIGKNSHDALYILKQYNNMIHEMDFDEEVLDEAIVFINTSKQAARIKCATIGYDALYTLLEGDKK